jgi:hypothetical protein
VVVVAEERMKATASDPTAATTFLLFMAMHTPY